MEKKPVSRAVVTVIGKDSVGILAGVSSALAEAGANVIEVTQPVIEEFFCMVVIVNIDNLKCRLDQVQTGILEKCPGMEVHVMHENIFNSMHRI